MNFKKCCREIPRGNPFLLFNCARLLELGCNYRSSTSRECFGKGTSRPFWKFDITIQGEKKRFQWSPEGESEEESTEEKTVISIRIRGVIIILFTLNRGDLSPSPTGTASSSLSLPGEKFLVMPN